MTQEEEMQGVGGTPGKKTRRKKYSSRWSWIAVSAFLLLLVIIAVAVLVPGRITTSPVVGSGSSGGGNTPQIPVAEGLGLRSSETEGSGVSSDYPYLAEVSSELEGKVQLVYDFNVFPAGDSYATKMKVTNLTENTIIGCSIEATLKDIDGKIISTLTFTLGATETIKAGESYFKVYGVAFHVDTAESYSPLETWVLELKLNSVNFE